jgi:hypothetical protein
MQNCSYNRVPTYKIRGLLSVNDHKHWSTASDATERRYWLISLQVCLQLGTQLYHLSFEGQHVPRPQLLGMIFDIFLSILKDSEIYWRLLKSCISQPASRDSTRFPAARHFACHVAKVCLWAEDRPTLGRSETKENLVLSR